MSSDFIAVIPTGVDTVVQSLDRLLVSAIDIQCDEVHRLGEQYLTVLRNETPIGRGEKPGRLRGAYQVSETSSGLSARYQITNTTPYIKWVIGGRGPVEAKGKALRFVIDGKVFFRKRVGPAAPNPFDDRAYTMMARDIDALPDRIASRITGAVS